MRFDLYVVLGFFGGIPAGMGMGGGTVTIPLLVLFAGVEQKVAQAANLLAFLPMSAFALSVHSKNGLVKKEGIWRVIVPALAAAVAGTLLAGYLPSGILRRGFGVFLVILSFLTFKSVFSMKNA